MSWVQYALGMKKLCEVEGCDQGLSYGGMCSRHQNRLRKYGRLDARPRESKVAPEELLRNQHGNSQSYNNGCRCVVCTRWNAADNATRRAKRTPPPADDPRHGKPSTYVNWNCRCEVCTEAHSAKCKREAEARKAKKALVLV